jgi:MoxR-like ATPase
VTETDDATAGQDWVPLAKPFTDDDPPPLAAGGGAAAVAPQIPDRRDGAVYVMSDDLTLAVDVALATRRPLLLRGEPGSGKSSLAAFVARNLQWRYYEHVVTARTRSRDLLYTFDSVRKLADASSGRSDGLDLRDHDYVEPGVLWWAFDRESALRRGVVEDSDDPATPPTRPTRPTPPLEPDADINAERKPHHAVVLIDEIDKADPDLPNGLLVPLGSGEFRTLETGALIRRRLPETDPAIGNLLVVVTTNGERDLPAAFVRRCVTYRLAPPSPERLVEIGTRHLRAIGVDVDGATTALLRAVALRIDVLRRESAEAGRRMPSTAEFLDTVNACRGLHIGVDSEHWQRLERLVLMKSDAEDDERP